MTSSSTRVRILSVFVFMVVMLLFEACSDTCQIKNTYSYYVPVYTTLAEMRAALAAEPARDVKNPGKIYIKDKMLFVNEVNEGIHVFDNRNPAHPKAIGFIKIPGNVDMAIEGNTLYADSFIDLVALDISKLPAITEVNRIEGLFDTYKTLGSNYDPDRGIVVRWDIQENVTVEKKDCEVQLEPWGGFYYDKGIALSYSGVSVTSSVMPSPVSSGKAGSTARFAISQHHLYALDGSSLEVMDISSPSSPVRKAPVLTSGDVETLFPYKDHLFIGSQSGMYIFSLSNPEEPLFTSKYEHVVSCDPVVVEGDYAYVTLYTGNRCANSIHQLEVIDIRDVNAPSLVKTYPMTNPHGLGIDDGVLFICDGDDGLKIFDARDPMTIADRSLAHYDNINTYDVIPFDDVAIMVGSGGISQYDYSDIRKIRFLSQIPIVK